MKAICPRCEEPVELEEGFLAMHMADSYRKGQLIKSSVCDGTGLADRECGACEGRGFHSVQCLKCRNAGGRDCIYCGNSGISGEIGCDKCDGGRLELEAP